MKTYLRYLPATGLLLAVIMLSGCLFTATFVIHHPFKFTMQNDFYFEQVNLTDNTTWKDHRDQIDFIDAVGMILYITSGEAADVTFNAYADKYSGPSSNPAVVPTSATKIINDLVVPPGKTTISYKKSLTVITGLERFKDLVETGQFDFFATSSSGLGSSFRVDSGEVVITFSAHD
jgi:hypothetical protein